MIIMQSLFEEAEGWELISSLPGSPSTTIHILRRYTVQNFIQSEQIYAFKTSSLTPPATTKFISQKSITFKYKDITKITTEVKALQKLKPYRAIVELHEILSEDEGDEHLKQFFREFLRERDEKGKRISLILEYCPQGSLKDFLSCHKNLTRNEIIKMASEICECLLYLRDEGVLHRDIRTNNFLMTSSGLKLTDFDCAFLRNFSSLDHLAVAINKNTSAPQLLNLMEMESRKKDEIEDSELYQMQQKCDVYSFGCVLYEIMTGREFQRQKMQLLNFIEGNNQDLIQLTMKMLKENTHERLDFDQIDEKLKVMRLLEGIQIPKRAVQLQKRVIFQVPEANFHPSTLSKSQSYSLSISDWSLEEPTPQLYRKEVDHPDLHPTLSPSTPKFHKPLVHHTMIT